MHYLCEFGINHNRYAFCRVMLVGEKVIPFPVQSCSEGMVSYPKLANLPFRRSHFHRSENVPSKLRLCMITLTAVLYVFWTAVPCYLECCSS